MYGHPSFVAEMIRAFSSDARIPHFVFQRLANQSCFDFSEFRDLAAASVDGIAPAGGLAGASSSVAGPPFVSRNFFMEFRQKTTRITRESVRVSYVTPGLSATGCTRFDLNQFFELA